MQSQLKKHDVSEINYVNRVQGGDIRFNNTSTMKFTERHLSILQSLVRSGLSSLMMEDVSIRVDLSAAAVMDKASGEAYPIGKTKGGTEVYGISIKASLLKNIIQSNGMVDRISLKYLAETVGHELVHCKQYREGWLASDQHGDTLWKGELKDEKGRYFDSIQYRKQPWEVMAFAAEKSLGKAAIEDLIGQAIITVGEGIYVPKTDAEKASAAMRAIRVAERSERLKSATQ